jgi:hypothetical protein
MKNAFVQRTVTLTAEYQKLSATSLVVSGELLCTLDNAGDVTVKSAEGVELAWKAGEYHELVSVDLSTIEVKGTVGDKIRFVGGTW